MTDRVSEPPPRPPVRPLTEGKVIKGGHNPGTSQILTRPAAPAAIPTPAPGAPPPSGGRRNG